MSYSDVCSYLDRFTGDIDLRWIESLLLSLEFHGLIAAPEEQ